MSGHTDPGGKIAHRFCTGTIVSGILILHYLITLNNQKNYFLRNRKIDISARVGMLLQIKQFPIAIGTNLLFLLVCRRDNG